MNYAYYVISEKSGRRCNIFLEKNKHMRDKINIIEPVFGIDMPLGVCESLFDEDFISHQQKVKKNYKKWIGGTYGCFISHLKCLEHAIFHEKNLDGVFIFEDDALIKKSQKDLEYAVSEKKIDLLYLTLRMSIKHDLEEDATLQIICSDDCLTHIGTGTEGYYISIDLAKKIINFLSKCNYGNFPCGYDGFLQSIFWGNKSNELSYPGYKAIKKFYALHKINATTYCLNKGIVIHDDQGFSLIN